MSNPARPPRIYDYSTDGADIYRKSFAMIRADADLSGVPADAEAVAVRMIHACGQTDLPQDLQIHPQLVAAARTALQRGAPILTDATMIATGITRPRLPADNEVTCLLRDERVAELAREWQTTRSAAGVALWGERLEGAVVAIGNAPTALFHLLEWISDGGPRPAAIIGVPVGFVGSAESKQALAEHPAHIPFLVVHGRRGGSAMAVSAINALAQEAEI
ncbi:precorrin-8X methylmutase [Epidermidibacterium keratini]|uniref:Precorrin-8X methylmutase n=1 Tax=Epidermidibacterium keratini TaxID=1891644 RepID=A0A7L4YLZ8_9ACTN|nr:precorrin-8X methylmutase [Epidermidibacterium keratini]QHC00160.1 precorrin-8X methylmutase [Epidermidibacterium keratini]